MKKLSTFQRIRAARRALRAGQRKFDEHARRRAKRAGQTYRRVTGYWHGTRRRLWVSAKSHAMPSVLCFDRNIDQTIEFLDSAARRLCGRYLETKNMLRRNRVPLPWYDFRQLSEVSPSAGLVLAAEFDRSRILTKTRQMFTIDMDKWQPQALRTLLSLGLLPLLGIDDAVVQPDGSQIVVRFRSDTSVDMAVASDTLREVILLAASAAVIGVGHDPLHQFRTFLAAIGEALNNTSDHAYPEALDTPLPNVGRWWITGAVDTERRRMTFAVYDQGVTIPSAIPYGRRRQQVQRFVQKLTGKGYNASDTSLDGHAIAAAVRVGASGTGEEYRGHGLGLMRDYIRTHRRGRLRIVSRNGEFVACTGHKDEYRTRTATLHGTLVEWTVEL